VLLIPNALLMAAIGTTIAGVGLLAIHVFYKKKKITILPKEWKNLLIVAALFAATEFLWFDAVANIGSGKTMLLNAPLEPIIIMAGAFLLLKEKLDQKQIIGSCIAIAGVIISIDIVSSSSLQAIGNGELEAILAAVTTAFHYVFVAKLLQSYDTLECTAFILLFSGLMLNLAWVVNPTPILTLTYVDWCWLLLFSFVPMGAFLAFYTTTEKIGPSLASIVCTGSILLIIVLQLVILHLFGVPLELPDNLTLAVVGGTVSIVGIYIAFGKVRRSKAATATALYTKG
jgi:drug/metabolite transporter (DMT)-like permease